MNKKILIVEDEKELADILGAYLEVEGFAPVASYDGEEGMSAFYRERPALVLLDIMLPKKDGVSICREIRENGDVPIIMISAKSGEMDKVIALGIGADDYVTKPFSPLELVARVKANLRRYEQLSAKAALRKEEVIAGPLTLNKSAYTVLINGESLEMTTKEFDVLWHFAGSPNRVFSKEQIYNAVWGYGSFGDDSSVTVYIKRLREKLAQRGLDCIKTVWGAGYKLWLE